MSELMDWRRARRSRSHTRELVKVERDIDLTALDVLREDLIARIEAVENRVRHLENKPPPIPLQPTNDKEIVPRGIGDIVLVLDDLQSRLTKIDNPEAIEKRKQLNMAFGAMVQDLTEKLENIEVRLRANENKWSQIEKGLAYDLVG